MRKFVIRLFCGFLLLAVIALSTSLSANPFRSASNTVYAQTVRTVSQASYAEGPLATGSLVTGFGSGFANVTEIAPDPLNLPTILAGATVTVIDRQGIARAAQISYASPTQVNHTIPDGTALGNAIIIYQNIVTGQSSFSSIEVSAVSPGIFTVDASGGGIPDSVALRKRADGTDSYEPTFRIQDGQVIPVPIVFGPESDTIILVLWGTGFRNRSSLSNVTATIGGIPCEVIYAGPDGTPIVGRDQMNIRLPRSLANRGLVDVALTVDGKTANTVQVHTGPEWIIIE